MKLVPFLLGAAMGPMVLVALHGPISEGRGAGAALVFVLAHVAVVGVLLAGVLVTARRWPSLSARLSRLHRPSPGHVAAMLGSAVIAAAATHGVFHGGVA